MDAGVHLKRLQKWAALVLEAEKSGNKSKWCKQMLSAGFFSLPTTVLR